MSGNKKLLKLYIRVDELNAFYAKVNDAIEITCNRVDHSLDWIKDCIDSVADEESMDTEQFRRHMVEYEKACVEHDLQVFMKKVYAGVLNDIIAESNRISEQIEKLL